MKPFLDLLEVIQATNIPAILVVAGIVFVLLSMTGGFAGKLTIPESKQKWTGLIGFILLLAGVCLFAVPLSSSGDSDEKVAETAPAVVPAPPDDSAAGPPTPRPDDVPQPATHRPSKEAVSAEVRELQLLGLDALRDGDLATADAALEKAEALLGDALVESPSDLALLNLKGYLYKNWAIAYRRLNMESKARGQIADAEKTFRIVLAIDAENAGALNGLGSVFILRGRLDRAEEYIRKALEIRPDYDAAKNDLELIQKLRAAKRPK